MRAQSLTQYGQTVRASSRNGYSKTLFIAASTFYIAASTDGGQTSKAASVVARERAERKQNCEAILLVSQAGAAPKPRYSHRESK